MKRLALAALALLTLLSAGAPPAVEQIFSSGETLDFTLSWLRIPGGSARMTIAPLAGDSSKLRITSVAQTSAAFSGFFRVRDQIETIVSRENFSTLQYRKRLSEGDRSKDETTTIDPSRGIATRKGREKPVPTPVFDPLSLVYHLRMLELTPGKAHHFTMIADGKVYLLETNVLRHETVVTPAGTFQTIVVEPQMQGGGIFRDEDSRLLIWYSDDERRLPVRIRSDVRIGTITATLRSVSIGTSTVEVAATHSK